MPFTERYVFLRYLAPAHLQKKPGKLINYCNGLLIDYELVIRGKSGSSFYPQEKNKINKYIMIYIYIHFDIIVT